MPFPTVNLLIVNTNWNGIVYYMFGGWPIGLTQNVELKNLYLTYIPSWLVYQVDLYIAIYSNLNLVFVQLFFCLYWKIRIYIAYMMSWNKIYSILNKCMGIFIQKCNKFVVKINS